MAPAVVLWWSWRRGVTRARFDAWCELVIVLTYVIQFAVLAAGLIAARGYADPFDHLTHFAGLVGVIVAAEYAGHAAAAALAVGGWRKRARNLERTPCR